MPTRASPLPALFLLAACGGSGPEPVTPAAEQPSAAASAPPAAPPNADASPAPDARDPQIVALAKPALDCTIKNDEIDGFCPAYKAWNENVDLFREGRGSATVLSMLGDPDLKVRLLAVDKYIPKEYFADKGPAQKLFAAAKAEKNLRVARRLGDYAARVPAEDLGLADDLRALAKVPMPGFRAALAGRILPYRQTPLAIEVAQALIDDPDHDVQEEAVDALSSHGMTPATESVCKLLAQTIARSDETSALALTAGSRSQCPGIRDVVLAELTKRVADPTNLGMRIGAAYGRAAGGLCGEEGASPEVQKKAYALALKLTDRRVKEKMVRYASVAALAACDPVAAKRALTALSKDKDSLVAFQGKHELEVLVLREKAKEKEKKEQKK